MAYFRKIDPKQLAVGERAPWTIFDRNHCLLIHKGARIATQRQLEVLLQRGLFHPEIEQWRPSLAALLAGITNPLQLIERYAEYLGNAFNNLRTGNPIARSQLDELSAHIQAVGAEQADETLGAVHLCHEAPYTLWHPIHTALLCAIITRRLGLAAREQQTIVNAALSCNIAMIHLQESLYLQGMPLDETQRSAVQSHSTEGAAMLRAAGIEDEDWQRIVLQHHEMLDGSGYPAGLRGGAICREARIVALADRYSAMISPRAYREPLPSQDALRNVFLKKGRDYDEELAVVFVKEIGVYPPGTYVKLSNGETAVIIRRGARSTHPIAASFLDAQGNPLRRPARRDTGLPMYAILATCNACQPPLDLPSLWSAE